MLPRPQMENLVDLYLTGPINGGAGSEVALFKNDIVPSASTVLGDLEEADFPNYSRATLPNPLIRGTDPATGKIGIYADTPGTTWITNADTDLPQTIYGWYYVSDGGALAAVQRFPVPITLTGTGQVITFDPILLFENQWQIP